MRKKYWCRVYNTKTLEIYCVMMWNIPHLTKRQFKMIISEIYETMVIEGEELRHITADLVKAPDLEHAVGLPYGFEREFDPRFVASFWAARININGPKCQMFCNFHFLRSMKIDHRAMTRFYNDFIGR